MLLKKILVLSAMTAVFAVPTNASAAYVRASVTGGILVVNDSNGAITYCSGLLNGSTNQPLGQCAKIGTISTASLAGNAVINIGTSANLVAFVLNTATGVIAECSLMVNGLNGTPIGGCIARKAS